MLLFEPLDSEPNTVLANNVAEQFFPFDINALSLHVGDFTVTGELGPFKSGAVRLASELQVPLYVGALKGFHKLFPKGGRLSPRRMEIVFGGKLSVTRELTAQQTRELTSAVRERVLELKGDDKPLFKLQDPFRA